jgi:hypothetical protein
MKINQELSVFISWIYKENHMLIGKDLKEEKTGVEIDTSMFLCVRTHGCDGDGQRTIIHTLVTDTYIGHT